MLFSKEKFIGKYRSPNFEIIMESLTQNLKKNTKFKQAKIFTYC